MLKLSLFLIYASFLQGGFSIDCYQCNSTDTDAPYQCGEYFSTDVSISPSSCNEVYGAKYCIKHIGRLEGISIKCFQCFGPNNTDCTDLLIHDQRDNSIKAKSCDHVFEARYCIKATGLHSGGIGTRRYCSSVDMGNYCDYINQPGDFLEYRSCVYTCSTDGCNLATTIFDRTRTFIQLTTIIVLYLIYS